METLHAAVARSAFPSQNAKKHEGFGPFLEVPMSKKCPTDEIDRSKVSHL